MPAFKTASVVVSRAARLLGLVSADIADPYASTDANVLQLCSLLQELGDELVREHVWQQLVKEGTFNTAASTASYALSTVAPDAQRLLSGTAWNRTQVQPVPGSLSAATWAREKANSSAGIFKSLRLKGDAIHLHPVPSAVETLAFDYVSAWWVVESGSTPTTDTASAGTHVLWFDPDVLTKGLVWKFHDAKGFDTTSSLAKYETAKNLAKGQSDVAPTLSIGGRSSGVRFLDGSNIPDSGIGS